jgi:branched-chain amino acid transport system ATP-binding protein
MSSAVSERSSDSDEDVVIHGEDVSVSYGKVEAVVDADFDVREGEIVGVIGPNGAGKSTLANAVTGFHDYEGTLTYRGQEVSDLSRSELVEQGFIHCTEKRDLFGFMDVEDNLTMGAYTQDWGEIDEQLEFVYDLFPRLEERTDQNAHTLSGGEQQMLAIGRSLMGEPDTLLLDEPTLGLAPTIIDDISEALAEITESGMTILLCEQNVTFTMRHADRIYLLEKGEFVKSGTPDDLEDDDYVRDVYLGE